MPPYPKHQNQRIIRYKTSRLRLSLDTLPAEPACQHTKAVVSLVKQIQEFSLADREDTNFWPTLRGALVGTTSSPEASVMVG